MYVFEKKDTFFETLHPITLLVYLLIIVIAAILVSNPLMLAGLMLAVVLALVAAKGFYGLMRSLKIYLYLQLHLIYQSVFRQALWITVH